MIEAGTDSPSDETNCDDFDRCRETNDEEPEIHAEQREEDQQFRAIGVGEIPLISAPTPIVP